jgi:hypothetical protein
MDQSRGSATRTVGRHAGQTLGTIVLVGTGLTACAGHSTAATTPMSVLLSTTPVAAVTLNCHPAHILYAHVQNEPEGIYGVVWQTAGQVAANNADGWVAQLRKTTKGYVVLNCKAAGEAHG